MFKRAVPPKCLSNSTYRNTLVEVNWTGHTPSALILLQLRTNSILTAGKS